MNLDRTIYISASFPRRDEARALRQAIHNSNKLGWRCTSRWLEDDTSIYGTDEVANAETYRERARRDVEDVLAADVFVQFTGDNLSRGGRHGELGMAIMKKRMKPGDQDFKDFLKGKSFKPPTEIYIIGPKEGVFHHLPYVEQCLDVDDFLKRIGA